MLLSGAPGRCSCLMATKVVALLGKSLLGKVRLPATGAVGLPSLCLPFVMSSALNLAPQPYYVYSLFTNGP